MAAHELCTEFKKWFHFLDWQKLKFKECTAKTRGDEARQVVFSVVMLVTYMIVHRKSLFPNCVKAACAAPWWKWIR